MLTRTLRGLVPLLAMMLLSPLALPAQPPPSKEATATAMARIQASLEAAAETGIPVSLLESKVREGQAKNVPVERIAIAVETRLELLVHARDALRDADVEISGAGELSVAADAVAAGVSDEVLVRLVRTAPEDRRVVATAVLAQLVQLGFESEPAFTRVNAALASGPEALANLRAEVAAAVRVGGGPLLEELLRGGGG